MRSAEHENRQTRCAQAAQGGQPRQHGVLLALRAARHPIPRCCYAAPPGTAPRRTCIVARLRVSSPARVTSLRRTASEQSSSERR